MITVNTNLASLLVQKNFRLSTNSLNTAIERLTTGFRINSAKDDAAGKAVTIDMDVKLSSNEVAQNNVSLGESLLKTAEGNVLLIKDKVQRCRELCVQAMNGVYDNDSRAAIQSELSQLVDTVDQIKANAEFNGISLFEASGGGGTSIEEILPNLPTAQANGFIANVVTQNATTVIDETTTDVGVAETNLRDALATHSVIGISSATGLQALANVVNGENDTALDCAGKTFVLTQDVDLGGISNWRPIGYSGDYISENNYYGNFKGNFNGNGHTISNLKITNTDHYIKGLFGYVSEGTISNTCVQNATLSTPTNSTEDYSSGILVGKIDNGKIFNCSTSGNINSDGNHVGGIVGCANYSEILNSYSNSSLNADSYDTEVGGIAGLSYASDISNCFYNGNIIITNNSTNPNGTYQSCAGGIIGSNRYTAGQIENCYARANITVSNTPPGNVEAVNSIIGGIAGVGALYMLNCASDCVLKDTQTHHTTIGGLAGIASSSEDAVTPVIVGCYSKSKIITSGTNGSLYFGEGMNEINSCGNLIGVDYFTMLINAYGIEMDTNFIFSNCYYDGSLNEGLNCMGYGNYSGTMHDVSEDVDPSEIVDNTIKLQIGLDGSADSSITFDLGMDLSALHSIISNPASSSNIATLDSMLSDINSIETKIGVGLNRLESVQESLQTQQKTLTAARSVVQDTDFSLESARLIRSQILQQASASLLTVANQSPSLLLSLINGMVR